MADQEQPTKELINARYSVRVQGIPPDKATEALTRLKEFFSEWGDVDVNVNISPMRKPLTLEELQLARR